MGERLVIRCPCCGQIAPVDRLENDGPYPLELFIHRWGGKRAFTDNERRDRKGKPFKRGSAPGLMSYEKIETSSEVDGLIKKRVLEMVEKLQVQK